MRDTLYLTKNFSSYLYCCLQLLRMQYVYRHVYILLTSFGRRLRVIYQDSFV